MNKYLTLSIIAGMLLMFWACAEDEMPAFDPNEFPTAATYAGGYYPMTDSSAWEYDDGFQNLYRYVIGYDSTFANDITYKVVTSDQGEPDVYIRNEGNTYRQLIQVPGAEADSTEITFLIDNQRVEEGWEDLIPMANGDTMAYHWAIDDLEDTRRLNGNDLNDVIRVRLRRYFVSNGTELFLGTSYYWYAKGAGMIERDEYNGVYRRVKGYIIRL